MRAQASGSGKYVLFIQFVMSAVFTLALFYPNLFASFGLIDDHQIIVNLGPDRQMSAAELPERIMASEAGLATAGLARYRPAYWTIYLTEVALWGAQPHMWYYLRLLLMSVSVFIAWYLMTRLFGPVFSGLACLFLFTRRYWADIGARLGPAELYALFGVSIYCLSFYKLWKGRGGAWWALLAIGALISFGSKENFLFLVPATAALFYKLWKDDGRFPWAAAVSGTFIMAAGLLVGAVVLVMLSRTGTDIYGGSVNPVDRIAYRLLAPWNLAAAVPLMISVFLPAVSRRISLSLTERDFRGLFFAELLLFSLWTAQYFFYSGKLPTDTRYDFPGMFILGLSYVFLLHACLKSVEGRRAATALAALLAVFFVVKTWKGSVAIHRASVENMKKTSLFTTELEKISRKLKADPETPVILESHTCYDIEPVISFSRYLFYYGVRNSAAVYFNGRSSREDRSPLALMLSERMEGLEKGEEQAPPDRLGFGPYRPLKGKCFSVTFSGGSTLGCTDLGRIW